MTNPFDRMKQIIKSAAQLTEEATGRSSHAQADQYAEGAFSWLPLTSRAQAEKERSVQLILGDIEDLIQQGRVTSFKITRD